MQCYLILSLVGTCSIMTISAISCPSHTADPSGTGYTETVHGVTYPRTCPPGTVYHPTKCVCDFPPSAPMSMGPKTRTDQQTYSQQLRLLFNLMADSNRNTEAYTFMPGSNMNGMDLSLVAGSNTNTDGNSFLPRSNTNTEGLTFMPGSNMNEFGLPIMPNTNRNTAGLARNTNAMGPSFMPTSNRNAIDLSRFHNFNMNSMGRSFMQGSNMNTADLSLLPDSNTNRVGLSLQSKPTSMDKPTNMNLALSDLFSRLQAANKMTVDPTKYGLPKLPQNSNIGPALPTTQTFPIFRYPISSQGGSVSGIPIAGTNILVEGHSTQENNSFSKVEQNPSFSMPGLPTQLTTLSAVSSADVITRVQEPTWVANSGLSQPIPGAVPIQENSATGTTSKKESTNASSSATNSSRDPTVPVSAKDGHNQSTKYSVNAEPAPGSTSIVYTAGQSNQNPIFHRNAGALETPSGFTSNQMPSTLTSTILHTNQAAPASGGNNQNNLPAKATGEITSTSFPANFNMFNNAPNAQLSLQNAFNRMQLPDMPTGASNSFNLANMRNNFLQQNQQPSNTYPGQFNQENRIGNQQSSNVFPVSFNQEQLQGNQQRQNSYPGFLNQKLAMPNPQNSNRFPASFNKNNNMRNNLGMPNQLPQRQFPTTFAAMRALLGSRLPMARANTRMFRALGGTTGGTTWTPNRNLPWKMNMALATSMDATDVQREAYAKEVLLNQPNLSYSDMMQLTDML